MKPAALAAAALLGLPLLSAAESTDFRRFRGTFVGPYAADNSGSPAAGTVVTRLKPINRGRALRVAINGTVNSFGTDLPVSCQLILRGNRRVVSTAVILGLYGPTSTRPSRFARVGKRGFRMTLAAAADATLPILNSPINSASVRYTFQLGRRNIAISGAGPLVVANNPSNYTVSLTGAR